MFVCAMFVWRLVCRLEAINKTYVEGLKEVKALLDEGVLSGDEQVGGTS